MMLEIYKLHEQIKGQKVDRKHKDRINTCEDLNQS